MSYAERLEAGTTDDSPAGSAAGAGRAAGGGRSAGPAAPARNGPASVWATTGAVPAAGAPWGPAGGGSGGGSPMADVGGPDGAQAAGNAHMVVETEADAFDAVA